MHNVSIPGGLACGLLAALLIPVAAQGQTLLQARAYTYPGPAPVSFTGTGGIVRAHFPDALAPVAQAQALLSSVSTSALGTGTAYSLVDLGSGNAASGGSSWHYRLWDPATDQPLDFHAAFPYGLQFNLRMTGSMVLPLEATARGVVSFSLSVRSYDSATPGWSFYDNFTDSVTVTAPYGSYQVSGNAALFGNSDRRVTLYHDNSPEGYFVASATSTASGGAETHANVLLESVTLWGSSWPDNRPISLRLDDGTMVAVTIAAVPEAPTWMMWCAAAGLAGLLRRRKR